MYYPRYGEKRMSYPLLKKTLDKILEETLSKQLLQILDLSKKKQLTINEIIKDGLSIYGPSFKIDNTKETIRRYLNTFYKAGQINKIKQGKGKQDLWEGTEISNQLKFNIHLSNHIERFNRLKSNKNDLDFYYDNNISLYRLFGSPILSNIFYEDEMFRTNFLNKLKPIIQQYKDTTNQLIKLREEMLDDSFSKLINGMIDNSENGIEKIILKECESLLNFFFINCAELKIEKNIITSNFKENVYPYVIKANIPLLNFFYIENTNKFKNKQEAWSFLDGYKLSKEFSENLDRLYYFQLERFSREFDFMVICDKGTKKRIKKNINKKEQQAIDVIDFLYNMSNGEMDEYIKKFK